MKITGEPVVSPEGGFNPTWQRHVAAYALAEPLLGPGRVLDLGCGDGHSYHLLAPRETVGIDVDRDALARQDRETVVADLRALPFGDGSFDSVLSVQSLEHIPDPERAVAEVAARYMEVFDQERAKLDRLLGLDPLRLRRLVPLALRRRLYDVMLRRYRHADDPRADAIEAGDFDLRETGLEAALDACAVCVSPRSR